MHNARFMIVEGICRYTKRRVWLIISSSNKVSRILSSRELNHLINNGTIKPNNFAHLCERYASGIPEEQVIMLLTVVEHHGYFRTLKDVRDYIQILELMDNV